MIAPATSLRSATCSAAARRDRQSADRVRTYLCCLREGRLPDPHLVDAWERFFLLYRPLVRRVVKAHVARSDRDDCAQQAWVAVLRALESSVYDPLRGTLRCWIYRIIRNRVVDFLRTASRQQLQLEPDLEGIPCYRELDPRTANEREEERQLVRHVLDHLRAEVSEANYRIVHLRWIEGRDFLEIAAQLNLTCAETHYRKYRIKKRLVALLRAHAQRETHV